MSDSQNPSVSSPDPTKSDSQVITLSYVVDGSCFTSAGEASAQVKSTLRKLGFSPDIIRKAAISLYEGEINMVIHANGGTVTVEIHPDHIRMILKDTGKGIADIDQAMQHGFTTATAEVRELGFGAGMGLPNMKKYTDELYLESTVGVGTTVTMIIRHGS